MYLNSQCSAPYIYTTMRDTATCTVREFYRKIKTHLLDALPEDLVKRLIANGDFWWLGKLQELVDIADGLKEAEDDDRGVAHSDEDFEPDDEGYPSFDDAGSEKGAQEDEEMSGEHQAQEQIDTSQKHTPDSLVDKELDQDMQDFAEDNVRQHGPKLAPVATPQSQLANILAVEEHMRDDSDLNVTKARITKER